jgi:hypothetical protein
MSAEQAKSTMERGGRRVESENESGQLVMMAVTVKRRRRIDANRELKDGLFLSSSTQ